MIEYLSYFIFIISLIIAIIYFYIKAKYGFWVIQPVFHIYDIGYIIKSPGIIDHGLPKKNKYTNFVDIETVEFADMSSYSISKVINLINMNYFREPNNFFRLSNLQFIPYFTSHNNKTFISIYNEQTNIFDPIRKTLIRDNKMVSVMTCRPLNVVINNGNKDATFTCNYIDYLCVHKLYRKKGIAPQMIQTHDYNQRHLNKTISISLFKREDELTGIIPLCAYSTYGFSVEKWTKPSQLAPEYKLVEISSTNMHLLISFLNGQSQSQLFDIFISTETSNLIELIKTGNIFVYAVIYNNEICCVYFFRKTCIFVDTNLEVLSCFASVNTFKHTDIFIHAFKVLFWKIAAEHYFGFCSIENISHNDVIIDNLCKKTSPITISPTAYFFYNFVYNTSPSNKVLILS